MRGPDRVIRPSGDAVLSGELGLTWYPVLLVETETTSPGVADEPISTALAVTSGAPAIVAAYTARSG